VLTIGKLGSSRSQLAYYEQQVAAGIEDYYAGRGEARGAWLGSGADTLGMSGHVERDGFMALMRGRHPLDDSVLRQIGSCSTVAALDLTFSAPKSVSVLFAIADEHVSAAVVDAHERAVDAALTYLEREACWTRRGHAGAVRLRGDGLVAAAYRHRMSRAGDPQLHTHVVVANMTRAEGKYTALDAHPLYEHKSPAGAVYSRSTASRRRCCGTSRSDGRRLRSAPPSWQRLDRTGCRESGRRGSRSRPGARRSTA
jgi:conjugative relaxase-like TrwC/TraI family protein